MRSCHRDRGQRPGHHCGTGCARLRHPAVMMREERLQVDRLFSVVRVRTVEVKEELETAARLAGRIG